MLAGNTARWRAIIGLDALTDFLLVPIALSLYLTLRGLNKTAMLLATTFVGLFIVLDLPLMWINISSLMTLSGGYGAAADEAQRAAFVTAAMYPSSVLESNLMFVYNSLTLAVGMLVMGFVMRKGIFSMSTAYLGLMAGILGIVSVTSSFFSSSLSGTTIILATVLTMVWATFAGFRLCRLGQS